MLNRYSLIYFLLALITVFAITAWLMQPFRPEDYENLLAISGFLILVICGLILVCYVLKFNIQAQAKIAWLLIAAAIFSWAISILYNYVLQTEEPIIGGLLRLLGYAIFFLGLVIQWRTMEVQVKRMEVFLLIILFGVCLVTILILILNIPIVINMETLIEAIILAAYPIMDFCLTFISGVILWKVKRKKMVFPWVVLTLLLVNNMVLNWQQISEI
ncbi:MAG: hypothetical protein ACFFAE_12850 [Candidatus Hodarchaeota archaeon]